jgi:Bacterial Ig-like domain (group 3)
VNSISIHRLFLQAIILACVACTCTFAQSAKRVITLVKPEASELRLENLPKSEKNLISKMPANFLHLGAVKTGEVSDAHRITLKFDAETQITKITSTPDFKIEPTSSCLAGNYYHAKGICDLMVRFTPQGPGHRMGKVTIAHTAGVEPENVGLLGYGYAPVVSFTPSMLNTVTGTFPANKGLLSGAANLAVDGGDSLYIADTGNNLVRYIDSSGTIRTISSGTVSAPVGVAVDGFGDVYFSEPAAKLMYEIFNYGSQLQISGTGTDSCTYAAPCKMPNETLYAPGQLSMDANNQMFFAEQSLGAAVSTVLPYSPTFARIYDPFTYQETFVDAFAVDAYDNLYSFWNTTGVCAITVQTFSDSANSRGVYRRVAGGRACGFSGDGGPAGSAEMGTIIGQFAFDVAGNLYFTDTTNNRVRRIDSATGIIRTIAGTGVAGYKGDNGAATAGLINTPTGIAVDSQGQVYVINTAGTTGALQSVRRIGITGFLAFGSVKAKATSAQTVLVSNTGNNALNVTNAVITGTNAADFTIDPTTTSCNFAAGNALAGGQSCKVGIIFKPAVAGARSATLSLLDNTVTNVNNVTLSGTGTAAAAVKITSPKAGASKTAMQFAVNVTSANGPAPKGTVTFSVDGVRAGKAVKVAAGVASINLSDVTAGTHTFSAAYSGDANYDAASAGEKIKVKN